MDRRSRTTIATIVVAALTVQLAGCAPRTGPAPSASGSATTTTPAVVTDAADLLQRAVRNMLDAPSKRLLGTAHVSLATQEFDIVFVGDTARGRQVNRALGLESVVDFVRIDDSLYILTDEHYWQAYVNLEQLHLVAGEWVRVAADHPDHSALLVLGRADASLWEPMGELTQADTETIDGTPAVVLEDSAGNRFAVSADATPYLLRLEATQSTDAGDAAVAISFSDFGAVTETITAPTGEIIDLR